MPYLKVYTYGGDAHRPLLSDSHQAVLKQLLVGSALLTSLVSTAQIVNASTVTINRGDTLSGLATESQTTVQKLVDANHLDNPNLIIADQKLTVPDEQSANTDAVKKDYVSVKAGDTLSELSEKYGLSVAQLQAFNNLNGDVIYVGQKLRLTQPVQKTNSVTTKQTTQVQTRDSNNRTATSGTTAQPSTNQAPSTNSAQAKTTSRANTTKPAQNQQSKQVTQNSTPSTATSNSSEETAKNWIAQRESGGSYTARNGQFIGKYQLTSSYLNGDYSASNQERTAQRYVQNRYGSWQNAQRFWQAHNWY